MNIDYSSLVYIDDKNIARIQNQLIELLAITTQPRLDDAIGTLTQKGPISLKDFVNLSQSEEAGWMRKGVRANVTKSALEEEKAQEAQKIISDLKLFDGQVLPRTEYDGAVMFGSSTYLADRFFELQDLVSDLPGTQFGSVFLMGSSDTDLTETYRPKLEAIVKDNPERFKESIVIPEKFTEHEVMHFFIDNLRWPESFQKIPTVSLPVSHAKLGRKPTTQDEINNLNTYINENLSDSKRHLAGRAYA